jgi:LmbE family N-acetylglucosaminyl deacetylase
VPGDVTLGDDADEGPSPPQPISIEVAIAIAVTAADRERISSVWCRALAKMTQSHFNRVVVTVEATPTPRTRSWSVLPNRLSDTGSSVRALHGPGRFVVRLRLAEGSGMAPDTGSELGSILGIWGHPDDEAYLSAGLMMLAVEAGHSVMCVTATKGEAGFPADDPRSVEERMVIREAELAASLSLLGVTKHRWLGYADGLCADVPDEDVAETLAEIITEMQPNTVLTFAPDGGTGHPDHIAACRWTTMAVDLAGLPGRRLMYATKTRRWRDETFGDADLSTVMMVEGLETEIVDESELAVWLTCDDQLLTRKVAALRAQSSQIEPFTAAIGIDKFTELVREEFFRDPLPTDPEFIERARILGNP